MINSYDLKDEEQAKEYLEKIGIEYRFQCYHEKNPEGCHRLADHQESFIKDYEKAAAVFKTNCEKNKYGHSCYKYAGYKFLGRSCEKDLKASRDYYELGCERGYMPSCFNSGLMYLSEKVGNKDLPKSLDYFKKGCEGGDANSCYQLSLAHLTGDRGTPKDSTQAFQSSVKACDLGNIYACANVSQMYRKGDGTDQNMELSKQFKKKAQEMQADLTQQRRNLGLNQ